jgi:hypothetical protein
MSTSSPFFAMKKSVLTSWIDADNVGLFTAFYLKWPVRNCEEYYDDGLSMGAKFKRNFLRKNYLGIEICQVQAFTFMARTTMS